VVIVTAGGIGRPIDEVAVSLALFREHRVPVVGVILNKVLAEKYDRIRTTVARGLENLGTALLGAIPFEPSLTYFTMGQLAEELKLEVLCGLPALSNRVENTVVAAMEPQNVVPYIREHTLVIAPGDRLDNILLAITVLAQDYGRSGGLLLTGGISMDPAIQSILENNGIPVLVSPQDTFKVSSKLADLEFKIRTSDAAKIERLHALVEEHVDVDRIIEACA
jgi:BioD-like phosphotransacetylase family protein